LITDDTEPAWNDPSAEDAYFNPPLNDPPPHNGSGKQPPPQGNHGRDYSSLFDAPDMASFVAEPRTAVARDYEQRAKSLLKTLMVNSLVRENYADAATYLYYGPATANAAGYLAAADDKAKRLMDMVTSPANPYVLFGLAIAPLLAQLGRNHEVELAKLPEMRRRSRAQRKAAKTARRDQPQAEAQVKIKIPFLRKEIPVRINLKRVLPNALNGFRAQTTEPQNLVNTVFSDEKLIKELRKQGIGVRFQNAE
jgi:hypothetical protein